jgi:hypothetical protein
VPLEGPWGRTWAKRFVMGELTTHGTSGRSRPVKAIGLSMLFCGVAAIVLVVELIGGSSFAQALTVGVFSGAGGAVGVAIVNAVRGRRGG